MKLTRIKYSYQHLKCPGNIQRISSIYSKNTVSWEIEEIHLLFFSGGAEIVNSTVVRIFYTDLVGNKNRNDVKYDLDGLIGNCWNFSNLVYYFLLVTALYGGLLSLFLGFSCVSFCEIIYFLIIRTLMETLNKPKRNRINVEMFKRKH